VAARLRGFQCVSKARRAILGIHSLNANVVFDRGDKKLNRGKSNAPVLMPTLMSPHTLVARLNAHEMVSSQHQSIVAHHDPNAGKSIHMYARVSLRDSNDLNHV
jgi:hypothetical protein